LIIVLNRKGNRVHVEIKELIISGRWSTLRAMTCPWRSKL